MTATAATPAPPSAPGLSPACHRLAVRRCCYAVLYALAAQVALLTAFLLLAHFRPLHPVAWLAGTVGALCAPAATWLRLVPLLGAVAAHGLVLGKALLAPRRLHANRFARLWRTASRQSALLAAHTAVGALTAWLYAAHLPAAYAHATAECADDVWTDRLGAASGSGRRGRHACLNGRYALLLLAGSAAAAYWCVRERCRRPVHFVRFPLLPQARYLGMRAQLTSIISDSLRQALLPTAAFALTAYAVGGALTQPIARLAGLAHQPAAGAGALRATEMADVGQLLFTFVLIAQIFANLRLIDHLFGTVLTERQQFAVDASATSTEATEATGVTLVQALAAVAHPLVRRLAAVDLRALGGERTPAAQRRRQLVYALSVPGGHPYTWTALSAQCVAMVEAFGTELAEAVELALPGGAEASGGGAGGGGGGGGQRAAYSHVRGLGASSWMTRSMPALPGTVGGESASEMAAKLLVRQYNETFGIRNMVSRHEQQQQQQQQSPMPDEAKATTFDPCRRFNEGVERVQQRWRLFKEAVLQLPGIHYLFAADPAARLHFLLTDRAATVGDCAAGLAALCVHSLHEDRFGVVQADLARIVGALLRLRTAVERAAAATALEFAGGGGNGAGEATEASDSAHVQCRELRGTLMRSLGELGSVFGEYLPDLLEDAREIRVMEAFAQLRET